MRRLRVGYVGAGFVAAFHIRGWTGVRNADIVAICDRHKERARAAANLCRELGVGNPSIFTDVSDMMATPNLDAVWLTVPNFARLPVMETIAEEVTQGKARLTGVACEKPLARNVKESRKMLNLVKKTGLLHGYLENQVFAPSVVKGKETLWKRGASIAGRPYLARCAEEHGGPHKAWFWDGEKQGGGALNDMMCHSSEASRYLLTSPDETKDALKLRTVSAEIASLKWTRPEYTKLLKDTFKVDFSKFPVEDFARATITYETQEGFVAIVEATNSWSFVGPGLKLSFELLGPEYYMQINTLNPELYVFFSRQVKGKIGEDLVEKQTAEQGLMPSIPDEAYTYGYTTEDRHMVSSFLEGRMPVENWEDGDLVVRLLMTCYMAAEKGRKLSFPPPGLEDFVPKVAQGVWDPKSVLGSSRE